MDQDQIRLTAGAAVAAWGAWQLWGIAKTFKLPSLPTLSRRIPSRDAAQAAAVLLYDYGKSRSSTEICEAMMAIVPRLLDDE